MGLKLAVTWVWVMMVIMLFGIIEINMKKDRGLRHYFLAAWFLIPLTILVVITWME